LIDWCNIYIGLLRELLSLNVHIVLELVAPFAPESLASFTPESLANFGPK
jgi:hypothetical protein